MSYVSLSDTLKDLAEQGYRNDKKRQSTCMLLRDMVIGEVHETRASTIQARVMSRLLEIPESPSELIGILCVLATWMNSLAK